MAMMNEGTIFSACVAVVGGGMHVWGLIAGGCCLLAEKRRCKVVASLPTQRTPDHAPVTQVVPTVRPLVRAIALRISAQCCLR